MNAIQKTILAILCGLAGMSYCRARPEANRSLVTVRFGENNPSTASPIAEESLSTEAVTPNPNDTPQGDGAGDLSQAKPLEYPELEGSQKFTQPQAEPPAPQPATAMGRWVTVQQPVYGRFGRFRYYQTVRQWRWGP